MSDMDWLLQKRLEYFEPTPDTPDGSVLTSNTSQPGRVEWSGKAIGRMYLNNNQVVASNSEVQINGWTSEYETDSSIVDVDTANHRIYARRAGFYRVSFRGAYQASTTTLQGYFAAYTGSGIYAGVAYFTNVGGWYVAGNGGSDIVFLQANDYVTLRTAWNYAGAGNHTLFGSSRFTNFLSLEYVGP